MGISARQQLPSQKKKKYEKKKFFKNVYLFSIVFLSLSRSLAILCCDTVLRVSCPPLFDVSVCVCKMLIDLFQQIFIAFYNIE